VRCGNAWNWRFDHFVRAVVEGYKIRQQEKMQAYRERHAVTSPTESK
jgi:hypothetical protein